MNFNILKKTINITVLSILPILLIVLGINFKEAFPYYSLSCVDPEMAYLYNGLAILHGHFPYFVDHPGIPLQYISALVIQIIHLFRDGNLDEDVIQNPNLYIHAITYTFIWINAFSLFVTGLFTMNIFRRLSTGLLIQLTPFTSLVFLNLASRILPEFFSLFISLLFFTVTIHYIYLTEKGGTSNKRITPIMFAIATGFAISTKITFIPFIIIPILVLQSLKEKVRFLVYSTISIFLFMLPAVYRISYFGRWTFGLLLHSGSYGQGDSNLVDLSLYYKNWKEILNNDPFLIIMLLAFVAGILIYTILSYRKEQKNSILFRAFFAFSVVTTLTVIIIAKQLKFYYLSPAYCMVIPTLFLGLLIIDKLKIQSVNSFLIVTVVLFPILLYNEILPSRGKFNSISTDREITYAALRNKYNHLPIANSSIYYGSPFYAYSAFYGYVYSSEERRNEIRPYLNSIAPSFYTYLTWDNQFHDWLGNSYHFNTLLSKHDSIYVYLGDLNETSRFEEESLGVNIRMENYILKEYFNSRTKESFFLFKRKQQEYKNWVIECNIEDSEPNSILCSNGIKTTGSQSKDFSRSGLISCKLDTSNQFGLSFLLTDLNIGDKYSVSVWRHKSLNTKACLVLSSVKQNLIYIANSTSTEERDDWEKIEVQYTVDEKLQNEDIKIYCWQTDNPEPSYWDDFRIEKQANNIVQNNDFNARTK